MVPRGLLKKAYGSFQWFFEQLHPEVNLLLEPALRERSVHMRVHLFFLGVALVLSMENPFRSLLIRWV